MKRKKDHEMWRRYCILHIPHSSFSIPNLYHVLRFLAVLMDEIVIDNS
jgi:hypothetical protein